jgi:simple sugar transport system permease protein
VFYTPLWVEAWWPGAAGSRSALVVFATWLPLRVLVGAVPVRRRDDRAAFRCRARIADRDPSQFLSSLPVLATIIVLVIISRNVEHDPLNSPASLGPAVSPDA